MTWNPIAEPARFAASDIVSFGGVIIGASSAGMLARPDGIPQGLLDVRPLLDEALRQEIPFFGLCFGHQVMGWHLGVPVRADPDLSAVGTYEVSLTAAGVSDEIFQGLPERFLVQEAHAHVITQLPSGSRLLAEGERDPLHAVRFATAAWGVQFHPDVGRREMIERLRMAQAVKEAYGLVAEEEIKETPEAGQVLRNFGDIVRSRLA